MTLKRVGHYDIQAVELKSRGKRSNILNQIDSVQIFESIDSPFMTGTIVVRDTQDFASSLPLVGDEEVAIKISTPDVEDLDRNFYLYRLSDMVRDGVSGKYYALHIVAIEMRNQANKKISKPYSGEISSIVGQIISGDGGLESEIPVNGEPTNINAKYISPYWSPIKNINYCCMLAQNNNDSSSYVFFENRAGFNFVSLESLYGLSPAFEWVQDLYNRRTQSEDLDEMMKRVESFRVINSFDTLSATNEGVYSSRRIFFDPLQKKYSESLFDYFDVYGEFNHLNESPTVSNEFFRGVNAHVSSENVFTNKFLDENLERSDKQLRRSQLQSTDNQKVEIEVYGRLDITPGLTANLTIYSNKPTRKSDSEESLLDPVLSGRYLISSVNHVFNRDDHRCVIELVKESNL